MIDLGLWDSLQPIAAYWISLIATSFGPGDALALRVSPFDGNSLKERIRTLLLSVPAAIGTAPILTAAPRITHLAGQCKAEP